MVDRYFFPGELTPDKCIAISDKEWHQLVHVMRNRVGDTIEIVNGKGVLAIGKVTALKRDSALVVIQQLLHIEPAPPPLILAQGLPRPSRLDFIAEKGTELGMTELRLFAAERSDKKSLSTQQQKRVQQLLIAAMKQCERLHLPSVHIDLPLEERKEWPEGFVLFGDLEEQAYSFASLWQGKRPEGAITAFIGPESGFSPREIVILRQRGAIGVRLHPHILRTDTAALAFLTLISQWNIGVRPCQSHIAN